MKDGGAAFPIKGVNVLGFEVVEEKGMTLRDWFAGQALTMLRVGDANNARGMAERAYEIADAMLAARKEAGGE